ncbi:MAG: hypothetical protein ACRDJE_24485 [Dehalococcoidia bacterium]
MKGQRLAIVLAALTAVNVVILLAVLFQGRSTGAQRDVQVDGSVIRGRVLELVDESGQVRSRLGVEPDGEVVFRLLDEAGTIRVKLGASADGSGMVMLDNGTEPAVQMLATTAGPTVTLTGKDGQQLALKP